MTHSFQDQQDRRPALQIAISDAGMVLPCRYPRGDPGFTREAQGDRLGIKQEVLQFKATYEGYAITPKLSNVLDSMCILQTRFNP